MSLTGKTAFITGGAQGIGLAIGHQLARDGAAVVLADINTEKVVLAAEALKHDGYTALSVVMDVADEQSVNEAVGIATHELGAPTILVNNAGIYTKTPAIDVDLKVWHKVLDTMLTGPLLAARAVAPAMIDAKWGRIINMGSMMSYLAFGQDVGYSVVKAGMLGLTRSLAAELAQYQICVNTICPGNIMTALMEETARNIEKRDGMEPGSFLKERPKQIPLGRIGAPEDIAKTASYLCSDAADYVTGQSLHVNGGLYQS
jgi:NAD(P)-dependent dehydrogenase (short-subunit alcohol dehydrogenase family)